MKASVDTYEQMRVLLTNYDVESLESKGEIIGQVLRTGGEVFPLKIYRIENEDKDPEKFPKDVGLRRKGGYEVYVGRRGLELIKKREVVGTQFPGVGRWLRMVYVSLEDVF